MPEPKNTSALERDGVHPDVECGGLTCEVIVTSPRWVLNGVNVFSENLVRGLSARGVNAQLLITGSNEGDAKPMPLPRGIRVHHLSVENRRSWRARWNCMIDYLKDRAPCIYLPNHDYEYSCRCAALSKTPTRSIPIVWSCWSSLRRMKSSAAMKMPAAWCSKIPHARCAPWPRCIEFGRHSMQPSSPGLEIAGIPSDPLPDAPISEQASKRLLAHAGLTVIEDRLATTADEAADAARELGFPVVLKIASADIAPQDGGRWCPAGNRLRRRRSAKPSARLMEGVKRQRPEARLDGVLVSPMLGDGVETILGIHRDPVFGPVVMFGLGGVFVGGAGRRQFPGCTLRRTKKHSAWFSN